MLIAEKKIWTPDNSFLLEYAARIEAGEIIVGRELWQELQNLKEDMTSDAFLYDTPDALIRMDFMEHCIRLTKSPFYNKPMVLMLWQKAFIEAVYSFKMSDTTWRRFKRVLLLIARKNTKSETCSALGTTELAIGKAGMDIVCASNDDSQASIIYDTIDTMRLLIDPKEKYTSRNQRFLRNKVTNTKIFKMSERTRNKEGRNIDVGFLDESHEMKENVIAKPIEQSMSLKDEPLFVNLTTEGFTADGYLDGELVRARKIISGEDDGVSAIRTLPWLYTQDSEEEVWQNRKSWVKSNPSLGIVKKWDYLDEQIDQARQSKADRIFVLCKDFNIKQNSAESWLNLQDYDYPAKFDIEDFRGAYALGAVDLAETTDLASAKVLMMRPDDKIKYIYSQYFIPESKLEESDDSTVGAKYKEWAESGLLTISEGSDIDLSIVADWFRMLYEEKGIKVWRVGYDQKFAKDWITRMDEHGWTKENGDLIMILQNAQTLSNAMKLLEADFKHRLVNYDENKMDKWCLKNAGIQVDNLGRCLCVKKDKRKRIDGAVCDIILYETYRQNRTEFKKLVEGE